MEDLVVRAKLKQENRTTQDEKHKAWFAKHGYVKMPTCLMCGCLKRPDEKSDQEVELDRLKNELKRLKEENKRLQELVSK
jgi:hypothetical protein